MKAVAINSSPMMDKGNTAVLLSPFLEGMREAGAEVELFYTKKMEINPCQGEFNCWLKTPGKCFQQDDMQMLLPKISSAEILVLATPVYADGINGAMKNLLDRLIPLLEPFQELSGDHTRHPRRTEIKCRQMVLISNCGLWELDNFDPMLVHLKALCENMRVEFAGALLRPHGPALKPMLEMGMPVDDVLVAAKQAGLQLVEDGQMPPETLQVISHQLLPREMYIEIVNQDFHKTLDALEKGSK